MLTISCITNVRFAIHTREESHPHSPELICSIKTSPSLTIPCSTGETGDYGFKSFELNTGAQMPAVALGTAAFGAPYEQTRVSVIKAIEVGYRALDTAKCYGNEAAVGEAIRHAIKDGTVKREDVFVTTKIWVDDMNAPDILPAVKSSLSDMKLDYLDACLLHLPFRIRPGSNFYQLKNEDILPLDLGGCWKALEEAVDLGLAKAIGVSNCSTLRLQEIEPSARFLPAINQVEFHLGCEQIKIQEYCKHRGILVTAWSPLGAPGYGAWGTSSLLNDPSVKEIAARNGKSVGQVLLRWGLDKGVGLTVKSFNPQRMAQNLDIFGWTLSPEDHHQLAKFPHFKLYDGSNLFGFPNSPYKCVADMWDEE